MAYIYDLTDTWSAAGTVFNGIKLNVTNTASAAASKLVTLQIGGTEHFSVTKDGVGYFSGNVGIGTSSPAQKLSVSGNIVTAGEVALSGADFVYSWAGGTTGQRRAGFYLDGTNQVVRVYTAQNEVARFDASGNVGIGTSSPQRPLHVFYNSSVVGAYSAIVQGAVGGYGAGMSFQSNVTGGSLTEMARITADGESAWNTTTSTQNAGLRFYTTSTGTITEKMRIANDGTTTLNVGGVSSTHQFNYNESGGEIQLIDSTGAGPILLDNVSGLARLYKVGTGAMSIGTTGANYLQFITNGTERLRLDSGGNVGVGVSNPGAYGYRFGVGDPSDAFTNKIGMLTRYATATLVADGDTAGNGGQLDVSWASGGQGPLRFTLTNSEKMRIASSGNVGIGNTAPAHTLSVTGTAAISTSLQVANITTGANTTAGTITGNWTLTAGSRLQATYADIAEKYVADDTYEPGTVLMFGGEQEVTLATTFDSTKVAGVVTTNPAYSMNSALEAEHVAEIALQGRVPCKVIGPVEKGDLMVSAINGHAIANNEARAGTIIGKALENFTGELGIIEVAVGRF